MNVLQFVEVPPPLRKSMSRYSELVRLHMRHAAVRAAATDADTVLFVHLNSYVADEEAAAVLDDVLAVSARGCCPQLFSHEHETYLTAAVVPPHVLPHGLKRLDRFDQEFAKFFSRIMQRLHFVVNIDINGETIYSTRLYSNNY